MKMSIVVTINSRKLGRPVTFIARPSGYVYVDPTPTSWGQQLFDRYGNAVVAQTEEELRRIARRYISSWSQVHLELVI